MSDVAYGGASVKRAFSAAFARLVRVREVVARLSGWRALAANAVAGAVAASAFAPLYIWPGLAVGFALFLWTLDGARSGPKPLRAGFLRGWAFGFGYFIVSTYWMSFSMLVQAEEFAWMMPIAILGMPAFLGLFMAGAGLAATAVSGGAGRRALALALAVSASEYLRGHILTGLPWNLVGQALAAHAAPIQLAAFIGPYGLSFIVIGLSILPALAVYAASPQRAALPVAAALAGLAGLYALGGLRLVVHPPSDRDDVLVRVVQPSVPQREKIDPEFYWRNLDRNLALSGGRSDERITFVLWGENAAPLIADEPSPRAYVSEALPEGAVLLAGSVRRIERDGRTRYTNGFAALDADAGEILGVYDKHHLVPFGEYLPFEGLLRAVGLSQLAPFAEGLYPGDGPKTLDIAGVRVSPVICYETIFPGSIYPRGDRPNWIAIVTNDGWYGDTSGPRQHLDQARLRAVESGLPVARAANTGVSALIDGYGRYRFRIDLYEADAREGALPEAAPETLYARIGDAAYALMFLSAAALLAWPRAAKSLTRRILKS